MKFRVGENKVERFGSVVSFSNMLPSVTEKYDIKNSFTIETLRESWPTIVGTIMATHSYPDRLYKHTLFVIADHSIFSNELMMMKTNILKKMKNMFPNNPFGNMRVEVQKAKWR